MKARTAREKEVVALSASLPLLTPQQSEEAQHAEAYLYAGKKTGWCTACGGEIDTEVLWNNKRKRYTICPHCGARVEVKRQRKTVSHEKYYYTVVSVVKGWQVLRNFFCTRDTKRRMMVAGVEAQPASSRFSVFEVAQTWLDGRGVPVFMGRCTHMSWYYNDIWRLDTGIELKKYDPKYFLAGWVAKRPQLLPMVKRNGLNKIRPDIRTYDQIWAVLSSPEAETLAKAKQWKLFQEACFDLPTVHGYWPSIKIALRNGYKVKDARLWFDYLGMLDRHHKDLHNAKYVCPDDLNKAHDKEMAIEERRLRRERELEEKVRNMTLMERLDEKSPLNVAYKKAVGNMLAVVVEAGDITLRPLQDIKDFYEEGETLHHCVYKMGYYKHKDTLIVGARVKGKRTETIEINTRDWRIVQCRGKFNQDSEYHKQIYTLATNNLQRFAKCL